MRRKLDEPKERRTLQVCYVCSHKITGEPVYIGQDKYRHRRCEPGSVRWMNSQRAQESDVTNFFVEGCVYIP